MIGSMEVVFPHAYWHDQDPIYHPGHNVAGWFQAGALNNVPDRDLGWFLAQGWQVTAVADDPNNPPGKLYSLSKDVLDNTTVLNALISDYTTAFNEGREANDQRYDDLVVMYNDTLLKTHKHLNRAAAANNSYETLFVTSLSSVVNQVDYYLSTLKAGAVDTFDRAGESLNEFAATLSKLGTGYDEYKADIEAILTSQASDLSGFAAQTATLASQLDDDFTALDAAITDLETAAETVAEAHIVAYGAKLDELDADLATVETQLLALVDEAEEAYLAYRTQGLAVIDAMDAELAALEASMETQIDALDTALDTHGATYQGIVDLFASDFTTHAVTTRNLLTGLGTTELARINEQFDNLLAKSRQSLIDRGFYNSSLVTQVDARVERERNEAITALNDRLAREQVTHEHQLYGEGVDVRSRQAQGEQYLFGLKDMAIKYRAQWSERLYQQTVELKQVSLRIHDSLRTAHAAFIAQEAAVRERVFGWSRDITRLVAEGKQQIYQIREALSRRKADSEYRLADALRAVRGVRLSIADKDLLASMNVDKFAAAAHDSILAKLNGFIGAYADGVSKYAAQTLDAGKFLAGVREKAITDLIQTRFRMTDGLTQANQEQQKLYKYQLDARNNLAIGLFGFMERRTDQYPDIHRMGELAMGLGDAGATQVIQP